jgi:hypothetical protein
LLTCVIVAFTATTPFAVLLLSLLRPATYARHRSTVVFAFKLSRQPLGVALLKKVYMGAARAKPFEDRFPAGLGMMMGLAWSFQLVIPQHFVLALFAWVMTLGLAIPGICHFDALESHAPSAKQLSAAVWLGPPTLADLGPINNPCVLVRSVSSYMLGVALPIEGMLLLEAYQRRRFLLRKAREPPPLAPSYGRCAAVAVASMALQAWAAWHVAWIVDFWWLG